MRDALQKGAVARVKLPPRVAIGFVLQLVEQERLGWRSVATHGAFGHRRNNAVKPVVQDSPITVAARTITVAVRRWKMSAMADIFHASSEYRPPRIGGGNPFHGKKFPFYW